MELSQEGLVSVPSTVLSQLVGRGSLGPETYQPCPSLGQHHTPTAQQEVGCQLPPCAAPGVLGGLTS